ncbi:GTPase IMAP family member 8 [Triplophysa tibetana]|uniref:GTPase IMAP family member 8 n=1 Tax=Triplophysa tibetana TaxID=1572043 RepID=A0A5A9N2U8_9TELE|nr:GTPase IMAP family member 8 [Triplophysa tibetana]
MKILEHMKVRFGENMVEHTIVVLVRGEEERSEDPYERADERLKKILDECGKRICVYKKNQDMKESELVKELMEIWDKMQPKSASEDHVYEEVDDVGLMKMKQTDESNGSDITVVLMGKNNDDKCLIGNIILGEKQFRSGSAALETNMGEVADQSIFIIKTPDSFYSDVKSHMINEMKPSYTGPRAFLLLLEEDEVSREEMTMINQLKRRFGDEMECPTAAMTIVMLGQTGSGRSATGNTILGERRFESYASSVPVTQVCQKEEVKLCGMKITVVDTPDFFSEDLKNQEEQLRSCKDLIQHGPVVFLLVMELGRFTDGEREVLPRLKKEFVEGAKVQQSHKPITVVLLGTNSSNKCLIGNAILRQHCFVAGPQMIKLIDNTSVRIINTPDNLSEQEATSKEELIPSYPGPRLFLLVLEDNKLSQEEMKILDYLKERFGKNILENTIVVKVRGEEESSEGSDTKVLNECGEQISVCKNEDVKESNLMEQLKEKWDKIQKQIRKPSICVEHIYEDFEALQQKESTDKGEDTKVQEPHKDISLVLLGLKNNKCMIGNAILQEDWFGAGREKPQKVKQVEDRSICVINTPDNLHWLIPAKPEELNPSYPDELNPSYTEPRLFLLVLEDNKISQEEMKILEHMKERFGENMVEHTIVVLVRGEEERSEDPYERADERLKKILDEFGKRICVYKKNQDMKESELVKELMEIWDKMQPNSASEDHVYEEVDDVGLMKMKQTDESNGEKARSAAHITVVLLGKNNDDKCLIGNIILEEKRFKSEDCETNTGKVEDQNVLLIKTSDSLHPEEHMMEEMKPSYTGPRVFLLILQGHDVSQDELEMFLHLKKSFGEHVGENTILLVDREKPSLDKSKPNFTENLLREGYEGHLTQHKSASIMTIVLLGQTGSGKSATGNTILGVQHFESHASSVPVTQVCQKMEVKVCGVKTRVIDTPDFFSEDLKNQEEQLRSCKDLIQHGPVVFLLVMELGRFTDGEREVLPRLKKEFGEDMTEKTVILFTNKEKLKGKTLNDYINETDEELQKMIQTCHSRCCAFKNNKKNSHQVKELMDVILSTQNYRNMTLKPQRKAFDKRPKCRIM